MDIRCGKRAVAGSTGLDEPSCKDSRVVARRGRLAVIGLLAPAVLLSALVISPGVAAAASPKLTIKPSEIYYPCSEGNVTFTIKGFGKDKKVKLREGSAKGTKVATISTNSSGKGATVIDFTDTMPGSYPYYAVQSSTVMANATLTIGECP